MRLSALLIAASLAALAGSGCGGRIVAVPPPDHTDDSGVPEDDSSVFLDTGMQAEDSGAIEDAGQPEDAGQMDASDTPDAGFLDAQPEMDAMGFADAVAHDAGGFPDAAPRDAGFPDAGSRDGGVLPSSGCGTSRAGGVQNLSINVAGTNRTYILNVPTNYSGSTPLALAFGFHGQGWQASQFRSAVPDLERAAGNTAILVYPQGLEQGQGTGWSTAQSSEDTQLFDALVSNIESNYCIDQNRVFAFGRSFGAFFANVLVCARASVLRGAGAMMGGGPYFTCRSAASWWGEHSQDDPTVPYSWGTQSRDIIRAANGCSTQTVPANRPECVEYSGCANGHHVVWCSTNGLGHVPASWAPADIWAFFTRL
ncbi:MAG: hypothetical protein U1E65_36145 [Myxococcota bacterium]